MRTCTVIVAVMAAMLRLNENAWAEDARLQDLTDFRTPANAIATQISKGAAVTRPQASYLGVSLATDRRGRVVVEDVDNDSPASRAGLQPGDIVTRLDRRAMKSADDLRAS